MNVSARLAWATIFCLAANACKPTPSREEALAAMRRANPGLDSGTRTIRVWRDGPAWFSCKEVLVKLRAAADSETVRDQVGNWRQLVLQNWLNLRDTASGEVVDPGWCEARLTDAAQRQTTGWVPFDGQPFPTGSARRGWVVPVGQPRLAQTGKARALGRDTARAEFTVAVIPNAGGRALQVQRDTARLTARLVRRGETWVVWRVDSVPARPSARR